MDQRIEIIDFSVLILRSATHEDKVLLILYRPIQDLTAVLQPLSKKQLLIVSRSGDRNEEFVGIGFHCLFEEVVLLRLLEGMNLINDRDVAVK